MVLVTLMLGIIDDKMTKCSNQAAEQATMSKFRVANTITISNIFDNPFL